jgi:L-cysteine S-thiosulfotransferase
LWERRFANGKSYADCFRDGGKNVAADYPQFDDAWDRVVTFEMAINDCRISNGEVAFAFGNKATMGALTAYARTLSDGARMHVRVEGARAIEKYEAGKKIFFTRMGQLNFACSSCHILHAGQILRMEILSPAIGQATHWPAFRGGDNLTTLQARYQRCMEQIRMKPYALGSEELNNLEYFHSYISNGLPMRASVFRK